MASLTEVAYYSRKSIKFGVIGIVAYIVLQAIVIFGINLYNQLYPPPPPPPTMGFGLLPRLKFSQTGGYNYNFNLQTPTRVFPQFSDRASVFYVPQQKASLFAYQQAENTASKYKFSGKGQQIGETVYQWQKRIPQALTMKIDIITGAFDYEYQWQADTSILNDKRPLTEDQVYQIAASFLRLDALNTSDIDLLKAKLTYYKASAGSLVPVLSLSEADFIKVDYFRNNIDDYQVVTYKPQDGIISMLISKSSQYDKQVISANFDHYAVNYLQPETYPLMPIATAWEQLKSGQAYIASNNGNSDQVNIRRIELAYFDPPKQQEFFQPVYVFRGDNDFIAYIPAISDSVIKK